VKEYGPEFLAQFFFKISWEMIARESIEKNSRTL
jgi:hypothetical protein